MPENLKVGIDNLTKQAPTMVVFLLLVGLFLYYQEREKARGDLIARNRVEVCHRVQEDSIEAIKKLTEAMQLQAIAFNELSVRLEKVVE